MLFLKLVGRTSTGDGCLFLLEPRASDLKPVKNTRNPAGYVKFNLDTSAAVTVFPLDVADDRPEHSVTAKGTSQHMERFVFGISPMTTEFFIARGALFRRERLAICNFPRDQQKTCAAGNDEY